MKYIPHVCVQKHRVYIHVKFIEKNSVEQMANTVIDWIGMFTSFEYRSLAAAIKWDLETNYGVIFEEEDEP